jgi:hypothetical protein
MNQKRKRKPGRRRRDGLNADVADLLNSAGSEVLREKIAAGVQDFLDQAKGMIGQKIAKIDCRPISVRGGRPYTGYTILTENGLELFFLGPQLAGLKEGVPVDGGSHGEA